MSNPAVSGSVVMRVMTVDDHPIYRGGLAALIAAFDTLRLVAEASNGREAVERYRQHRPDVTLMDLSMPAMDGFATIHQLRRLLGLRDVPVIAVSAHAAPEIREDALALGCRDFITKPVRIELLQSAVERHLPKS